jgi:hypothetical protein
MPGKTSLIGLVKVEMTSNERLIVICFVFFFYFFTQLLFIGQNWWQIESSLLFLINHLISSCQPWRQIIYPLRIFISMKNILWYLDFLFKFVLYLCYKLSTYIWSIIINVYYLEASKISFSFSCSFCILKIFENYMDESSIFFWWIFQSLFLNYCILFSFNQN